MSAPVLQSSICSKTENVSISNVSVAEAEEAIRVLTKWIGDDPHREGLLETPARVTRAFAEWFSGYDQDPDEILSKTFEEVADYDDLVLLRGIKFESYCEHHMAPIIGEAHVAYKPNNRVVGLSKIARLVDIYAKRLQIQEKMTAEIADSMQTVLQPEGVAVMLIAEHQCMSTRGVHKQGVDTITHKYTGVFKTDVSLQERFLRLVTC
jgi:GTP cyclohydrolase I